MSAPRSPNGKRLMRPIVASSLRQVEEPDEIDELVASIDHDIRQLVRCLILWIAFLTILYLHTVNLD